MRYINSLGFWNAKTSSNLSEKTRLRDESKKKKNDKRDFSVIVDFVPVDHRLKVKESGKKDLDLARELRNYGT